MRIPDETYYKQGQKKLEDTRGWVLCTHCAKCSLVHVNQIHTDGYFYCHHREEWKEGDDLLEWMCDGYVQKKCSNCWNRFKCSDKSKPISYCNSYRGMGIDKALAGISGRRRPLRTDRVAAIEAEQMYIDIKADIHAKNNNKEAIKLISNNQRG